MSAIHVSVRMNKQKKCQTRLMLTAAASAKLMQQAAFHACLQHRFGELLRGGMARNVVAFSENK